MYITYIYTYIYITYIHICVCMYVCNTNICYISLRLEELNAAAILSNVRTVILSNVRTC